MPNYFFFPVQRRLAAMTFAIGMSLPAYGYSDRCHEEIQALCADVISGEGRRTACAIERREQVSVPCKIEVHALIEQRRDFRNACGDDAKFLCTNLRSPPRSGRLYTCLRFNEEQISLACKNQLK